jgi:uncharacterized membrane protein
MTAVATEIHGGRAPRWLMPLLVGSLALNLVVIGAAGSLLWRGNLEVPDTPLARRVAANVVGYAVTLPPERVQDLKRLTQAEWQKVQPLRRSLLAARDEVATLLSAQPFDRERFLAAQARLIEADRAARQAMFALHTAISVNLTPEERRDFLRWREQQQKLRPRNPLDTSESIPAAPQQ